MNCWTWGGCGNLWIYSLSTRNMGDLEITSGGTLLSEGGTLVEDGALRVWCLYQLQVVSVRKNWTEAHPTGDGNNLQMMLDVPKCWLSFILRQLPNGEENVNNLVKLMILSQIMSWKGLPSTSSFHTTLPLEVALRKDGVSVRLEILRTVRKGRVRRGQRAAKAGSAFLHAHYF